ncbi:MAG TPA: CHRD domain-containing protein [Longimicrobiales bacterium]|nr:CHRD domain-containing protein [Longimicrobiales bacterium]
MRASVLIGLAAFLTACTASMNGGLDVDPVSNWSAELSSQSGSTVRGAAAAQSAVATTGVSVSIRAEPGARHPWHIHVGTCGSNGAIVGDAAAYPVLQVGSNGVASATANLLVGLNRGGQYYVNVHRSPQNLGTIVACGALRP